tara:strand:- start:423 stop:818 length:396 start_codon:yes stop_codon:yes gene_type:complete
MSLNNDVIETIFDQLDWDDQIRLSHIIKKKYSQYSIALKKLRSIGFDPSSHTKNIYKNAMQTGDLHLCTEALYRMHAELGLFDNPRIYPYDDHERVRKSLYSELQNKSKCSRIERVNRLYGCVQTWDHGLD